MPKARPTRATLDGCAYLDLQNLARKLRRPTDELHQLYALEGFLARLSRSRYASYFVLKGGVLLAAFDSRRPTRDIDLHAQQINSSLDQMLARVREIAVIDAGDGLTFDPESAVAATIRDDEEYNGIRVSLTGNLSIARISFHIDINVGDPVVPGPEPIDLPRILGGSLRIDGYPLPMVHAEKVVTMLQRQSANTRWRDFGDVYMLARRQPVNGRQLRDSILAVSAHRNVQLIPLAQALSGYAASSQSRWSAWRRKQQLESILPADFAEVVGKIIAFADPAIAGDISGLTWDFATFRWETSPRHEVRSGPTGSIRAGV